MNEIEREEEEQINNDNHIFDEVTMKSFVTNELKYKNKNQDVDKEIENKSEKEENKTKSKIIELDEDVENLYEIRKMLCEEDEYKGKFKKYAWTMIKEDKNIEVNVFVNKKKVEFFDKEIEKVASEDTVSSNKYVKVNNNSLSIGVVMYLESYYYEKKPDIHIKDCSCPSILAKIIKKAFEKVYKINIKRITMGHEHGDKNNRCHLQIIINFGSNFKRVINPGAMKIIYDNCSINLLYMQQKCFNNFALQNYCEKEGDITIIDSDDNDESEDEDDKNVYQEIVENKDKLNLKEARNMILEKDPASYFRSANNMELALYKIVGNIPKIPFEWIPIPEHLYNYQLPNGENFAFIFNAWYTKYCINGAQYKRKKALCLYSKKRAMGKSYFVRHLVSDPGYILEFNNTFCKKENMNKGVHKLLLLDDMGPITPITRTMWLSLVASEKTTIRGAWVNEELDENLPCIITTNSDDMLYTLTKDPAFSTQVIVIEIKKYMGPEGTMNNDLYKEEVYLSVNTQKRLDEKQATYKHIMENL